MHYTEVFLIFPLDQRSSYWVMNPRYNPQIEFLISSEVINQRSEAKVVLKDTNFFFKETKFFKEAISNQCNLK